MEWLMGKARGVGRGLIHAPTSVSALTLTDTSTTVTLSSSPSNGSACISPSVVCSDCELKNYVNSKELLNYDDQCANISCLNTSTTTNSEFYLMKCGTCSVNQNFFDVNTESQFIKYTDKCYLEQQLPLSPDMSYPGFSTIVEPFPLMDTNEWLAAHTIALFDNLTTIFDAIYDLCDCSSLLDPLADSELQVVISSLLNEFMNNPSIIYLLQTEDERSKKSKGSSGFAIQKNKVCARLAIDSALSSCHDLIQSSRIFPVRNGEQFPSDLPHYVSIICKNLLVCILHIYASHIHHLDQLELVPHMNTLARHFFAFNKRFSLIEDKHLGSLAIFEQVNDVSNE